MEELNWFTGIAFPYINFFIFFGLLVYFARKPLKGMAEERYKKYVELHAEAKKAFDLAVQQNEALKLQLENLGKEIEDLRKSALVSAEREMEASVAKAKSLSSNIIEEARNIAEAETETARELIRQEIVDQLTKEVKKMISTKVNDSEHQAVITNKIKNVETVSMEGALR